MATSGVYVAAGGAWAPVDPQVWNGTAYAAAAAAYTWSAAEDRFVAVWPSVFAAPTNLVWTTVTYDAGTDRYTAALNWNSVAGALTYEVLARTTALPSLSTWDVIATVSTSSYSATGLTGSSDWEFQVRVGSSGTLSASTIARTGPQKPEDVVVSLEKWNLDLTVRELRVIVHPPLVGNATSIGNRPVKTGTLTWSGGSADLIPVANGGGVPNVDSTGAPVNALYWYADIDVTMSPGATKVLTATMTNALGFSQSNSLSYVAPVLTTPQVPTQFARFYAGKLHTYWTDVSLAANYVLTYYDAAGTVIGSPVTTQGFESRPLCTTALTAASQTPTQSPDGAARVSFSTSGKGYAVYKDGYCYDSLGFQTFGYRQRWATSAATFTAGSFYKVTVASTNSAGTSAADDSGLKRKIASPVTFTPNESNTYRSGAWRGTTIDSLSQMVQGQDTAGMNYGCFLYQDDFMDQLGDAVNGWQPTLSACQITVKRRSAASNDSVTGAKWVTSNVGYIATVAAHGYSVGQTVRIAGTGAPWDGDHKITKVLNSTQFGFAVSNANVALTYDGNGTVTMLSLVGIYLHDAGSTAEKLTDLSPPGGQRELLGKEEQMTIDISPGWAKLLVDQTSGLKGFALWAPETSIVIDGLYAANYQTHYRHTQALGSGVVPGQVKVWHDG